MILTFSLQVIIKWRGKPVFIRHRTQDEIDAANKVNVASLRDPQTDDERVKQPEWLVMLGMKALPDYNFETEASMADAEAAA